MIEKLLENWLDSASELSYQPVFVQMLSAQGFRVVHSTRHAALEYGKDVLAINPDGRGCAYQLKGQTGGKLGLEKFRSEMQTQLVQLISQAIVFPGFPAEPHKSYLVMNGYFEEEVQRAIDDLNRGHYLSKVELVSRGHLLSWSKELGTSLWPSELTDTQTLLELYFSDPQGSLPTQKLARLLAGVLLLDETHTKTLGKAGFYRAVTSAALLTGIATSRFSEMENHFAVVSAWTLFAVSIIAAGEKHGLALQSVALDSLELAEGTIRAALAQLWKEVNEREHLVEGNPLADLEIYGWRNTTLLGLLSCLAITDDVAECLDAPSRTNLHEWLQRVNKELNLWGEGAVSSLVPWLVWMRKKDATLRPDYEIAALTRTVIRRNQRKSLAPLAGPYYDFEEIARFTMKLDKIGEAGALRGETLAGSAFTAEALMHFLVRTNLKQECKMIWPEFSKLSHRYCLLDHSWSYCTVHAREGIDVTRIYPNAYTWSVLKSEATQSMKDHFPDELAKRPWLLALWWQVVPYRYTTAASHTFIDGVLSGWGM